MQVKLVLFTFYLNGRLLCNTHMVHTHIMLQCVRKCQFINVNIGLIMYGITNTKKTVKKTAEHK